MANSIAFLGPEGTHSHLALLSHKNKDESGEACSTISAVFEAVKSGKADSGFVPLENSIEGTVSETLDQLFIHRNELFIENSFVSPIVHSFGTHPGNDLKDLLSIYSHPQALGQCSKFLEKNCPSATLCAVSSTVEAVNLITTSGLEKAGVVAPKEALEQADFEIKGEDIANTPNNQTRFILIKKGKAQLEATLPGDFDPKKTKFVTSLLIHPGKDRRGLLHEILELISLRFGVNLYSIQSRPDPECDGYIFYLELEGHPSNKNLKSCLKALRVYADDVTGDTVKINVFGSYPRAVSLPTNRLTVGVIGGEGRMGRLLSSLFADYGHEVLIADPSSRSSLSNKDLASQSDVVVLSVPMAAIKEVCSEIAGSLKPGKLVVENCSIKESSLANIQQALPKEVEVLGVHTLFGDSTRSVEGQNIIFTRSEETSELAGAVEEVFYKAGARITYLCPESHDACSALVQSLVHLVAVGYGAVLTESGLSKEDLQSFSTPNSRALQYSLRRITSLSDELLVNLQTENPRSLAAREELLKKLQTLVSDLAEGKSESYLAAVSKSRELFS